MGNCDLKILEQIHLKVVEASPDAIIVIDRNGTIIVFKAQAELMFGYDRSEVIGQPIQILVPEDQRNIHITHISKYFEEPHIDDLMPSPTLNGRNRDGFTFPIQIKIAPIIVCSGGVHAMAVVRRVKDRK